MQRSEWKCMCCEKKNKSKFNMFPSMRSEPMQTLEFCARLIFFLVSFAWGRIPAAGNLFTRNSKEATGPQLRRIRFRHWKQRDCIFPIIRYKIVQAEWRVKLWAAKIWQNRPRKYVVTDIYTFRFMFSENNWDRFTYKRKKWVLTVILSYWQIHFILYLWLHSNLNINIP